MSTRSFSFITNPKPFTMQLTFNKSLLFQLLLLFILSGAYEPLHAQSIKWATKATSSQQDYVRGMTVDNSGNYYTIGKFSGTLNFDSAGFSKTLTSAGQSDIYLARFDCSRNLVWSNRIGGTSAEGGAFNTMAVKYDNKGNLYIIGTFAGTATFPTKSGSPQTLTSAGSNDIFFAKYDTLGVLQWTVKIGGTGTDEGTNIVIDRSGNIIICGSFSGTATWGATSGSTPTTTSGGTSDACFAKYTPNGQPIWVKTAGSPGEEIVTSLAVDKQNSIYSIGNFACCSGGTATFGTKSISNQAGSWGAFIAKMDSNGYWVWVNGMGGTPAEAGSSCAVDDYGNVFVSGHFDGNSTLSSSAPGSAISLTTLGSFDIFLAKYDTAGVLGWAKRFGGPGSEANRDLLLSKRGNIILTGEFSNTADFGGTSLISSGSTDIYIAEYTQSGNLVQCVKGGGAGTDIAQNISMDLKGALYVGGSYTAPATFGSTTLTGLGAEESFVVRLSADSSLSVLPQNSGLCTGDSVLLRCTLPLPANVTLTWLLNGAVLPGETNNAIYAKTSGTYRMVVTDQCNESDTSFAAIIINGVLTNNISDKMICLGDSVQLISSGGTSYSWSPSTGLSNPNIANPYAKPSSNQQYIVTITNGNCTTTDTVMVNINTNCCFSCNSSTNINTGLVVCYPFNGNTNDESNNGNNGTALANATLTSDRKSITSKAYTFNGTSTARINIPASTSLNTATMTGFTYACWFNASASGTSTKRIVNIQDATSKNYELSYDYTTNRLEFINSNGTSSNIQFLSNTIFTTGTWYHVAFVIDAANKPKLYVNGVLDHSSTTSVVKPANPNYTIGNHAVNAWNFNGKIDDVRVYNRELTAAELSQIILQKDLPTFTPISDKTICLGDSVQLISNGGIAYSWSPSTGLNDPAIVNPYSKPSDTTVYKVTISNQVCQTTDTVAVNVNRIIHSVANTQRVCIGDSAQLSASGATTYKWSPATGLSDSTIANPKVKPLSTSVYYVTMVKTVCKAVDSIRVIVDTLISVNVGPDLNLCAGDSIQLLAEGADSYTWSPSLHLNNATVANPFAKPTNTIDYIVLGQRGACSDKDTLRITVCQCSLTNIFDTITVYDTSTIVKTIFDTVIVNKQVFDTVIVHKQIFDTTIVLKTVYDTIRFAVTDTLIIEIFSGLNPPTGILSTIKVYPNPSHDKVFISIDHFAQIPNHSIKVVNTLGQTVFSNAIDQQNIVIDVDSLGGPGAYFLQILNPSGQAIDTRKIIIR